MFDKVLVVVCAAGLVGAFCYRLHLLTLMGSVLAAIFGASVLFWGGFWWMVPLLVSFISCALLSVIRRLVTQRRQQVVATHPQSTIPNNEAQLTNEAASPSTGMAKREHCRDVIQVLANGAPAWFAVLAAASAYRGFWSVIFLTAVAALAADTWATEWGQMLGRQPRHIISRRPLQPGDSGGVTWSGSIGGGLGALAVILSGWPLLQVSGPVSDLTAAVPSEASVPAWQLALIVWAAAVSGGLIDSLLGATLQQRRRCEQCGAVGEWPRHCGQVARHHAGLSGLNNDLVNFLSIVAATLITYALMWVVV